MKFVLIICLALISARVSAQCAGFPATIVDEDCALSTPLTNNSTIGLGEVFGACNEDAAFNSFNSINLNGGVLRICGNTSVSGSFNSGTIVVACGATLDFPSGLTLNQNIGIVNYGTITVTGDLIYQNSNSYIYNEAIDSRIYISGDVRYTTNNGQNAYLKNNGYISVGGDFNALPGGFTCLGPGSRLVCDNIQYLQNCGGPNDRFTFSGGSNNAIVQYSGNATIRGKFTASNFIDVFSTAGATALNNGGCSAGSWGSATVTTNTTTIASPPDQTACSIENCFTRALPIELIDFSAKIVNNSVRLDWSTASEINNDFFTIEKSNDGINWEVVKMVNGSGNSSKISNYTDYDTNPLPGTSYYRLKQTDFDEKFSYSLIEVINNNSNEVSIYPNPAQNKITVTGSAKRIELINFLGEIVLEQELTNDQEDIIFSKLISGTYVVRIIQDNNVLIKKIVIENK